MDKTLNKKYQYHRDGATPKHGEIFVYGANQRFAHGAGAARAALQFGAIHGRGPVCGKTYGIPTKDHNINTLSLDAIAKHVLDFIERIENTPDIQYFVTAIGTGLAGYSHGDIAPMFKTCPTNCSFPEQWERYLE